MMWLLIKRLNKGVMRHLKNRFLPAGRQASPVGLRMAALFNAFVLVLAPVLLILFKFCVIKALNLPWFPGDPLIVLVAVYTFFNSLGLAHFFLYSGYCGFLNDIIGLEVFGIYMFSYMVVALAVSAVCRVIYRHNRVFIFPLVFCAAILNNIIFFIMNWLMGRLTSGSCLGWFAGRSLLDAFAAVLLVFFLRVWLASIFEARADKCV